MMPLTPSSDFNVLGKAAFEVIERLPDGVIVLNGKLRTIYANPEARRIEATGALRLCPKLSCEDAAVAQRIWTVLCNTVQGSGGAVSFFASSNNQALLTLLAAPMRERVSRQSRASNVNDPAALIFVMDIAKRRQFALEQIRQAYGLTLSEARVALGIGGGASATRLARATNVSPTTIKTHLQKVFAKTATQRQSELARLVSALNSINLRP